MIQNIAKVQFASAADYDKAIEEMVKVRDQWMSVRLTLFVDPYASQRIDRSTNRPSLQRP